MKYTALIIAVTVICNARAAVAQMVVSATQIQIGDWTLAPILTGSGQEQRVHSFLALLDQDAAAGENITAVWYIRGINDDSDWQPKAWSSQDQWDAINAVKAELGIDDESDLYWPTKDPKPVLSPPLLEPVDYIKGVLALDPLAGMIAVMEDRDELIEHLVELGYKAADVPLEKALLIGDCQEKWVLTSFAKTIEAVEASPLSSVVDGVTAGQAFLATKCAAICFPYLTVGPWLVTPPGTWIPGPWVFDFCTPTIGGCSACTYHADVCRPVSRTWVFVWPNCSTSTWTTTSTQCWTASLMCLNTAGGACPAAPACATPALGAPPAGVPIWMP